jgi:hypothetical protein
VNSNENCILPGGMTLLVMPTNAHDMVQKNLEEIIVDNVEIGNQGGIEVEIEHITGVGAVADDLDKLGLSGHVLSQA